MQINQGIELAVKCWPTISIVGLAVLALAAILWDRHHHDPPKGIGVRAIRLLCVVLVLPAVGILAIEGKLDGQATASLLGTVIGYVLSGIGRDEKTVPFRKS